MKKLMALLALTAVTACDRAERKDFLAERADGLYRGAMDDYRAGRLDAAIAGFEKVIRKDPANASARFQLACLQQDAKKEYVDAYCGYREFLLQHPDSDRAKLARDRIALCEKEVAKVLSAKCGLSGSEGLVQELEALRRDLAAARSRVAAAEKNLAASQARTRSLLAERERLMAIVKGAAETDASVSVKPPSLREAKDLLEEDEASISSKAKDEIVALRTDEAEDLDSVSPSVKDEVASLKAEENEELSSGSSLLPGRKPTSGVKSVSGKEKDSAPAEPARPKTYEVKEGDTLYGIARRFYGSIKAGHRIREANKAVISTDGRVRAGDVLVLP